MASTHPHGARPIVIDTDPGVDDAMAIFMALASPEVEVLGLTTVFGNAEIDVTTRNALALLEAAGRSDLPVARGAAAPLATDFRGAVPHIHGVNGLGGDEPVHVSTAPDPRDGAEVLHDLVVARPGEVTIVALGPLTNLATALRTHPGIAEAVAGVVVMGGNALVPGNATPAAEANIIGDPEAADLVFGADWSVTMVGLDVTNRTVLDGAAIDRIAANPSPTAQLLARAMPLYRAFFGERNGIDGLCVHDPSTIAYVIEPDAFVTQAWPLRVETESFSRGKTWPSLRDSDEAAPGPWQGRPSVAVCTEVDTARVLALVEDRLSR